MSNKATNTVARALGKAGAIVAALSAVISNAGATPPILQELESNALTRKTARAGGAQLTERALLRLDPEFKGDVRRSYLSARQYRDIAQLAVDAFASNALDRFYPIFVGRSLPLGAFLEALGGSHLAGKLPVSGELREWKERASDEASGRMKALFQRFLPGSEVLQNRTPLLVDVVQSGKSLAAISEILRQNPPSDAYRSHDLLPLRDPDPDYDPQVKGYAISNALGHVQGRTRNEIVREHFDPVAPYAIFHGEARYGISFSPWDHEVGQIAENPIYQQFLEAMKRRMRADLKLVSLLLRSKPAAHQRGKAFVRRRAWAAAARRAPRDSER